MDEPINWVGVMLIVVTYNAWQERYVSSFSCKFEF